MIRLAPTDRILVRMPSWLGDFVMAEPFVRALLAERPPDDPRVSLVAPGPFLGLLDDRFDRVQRVPVRRAGGGWGAEHGDPVRWADHDVAVFLDGSTRSVWRALLARIPARVGQARGPKGLLLTHSVRPARERGATPVGLGRPGRSPRWLPRPFSSVCHELAGAMGVQLHDVRPVLTPSAAARETVAERLRGLGQDPEAPFVLLNAGARPGSAKGYPPASWARVAERIAAETREPVLVVGGPGEQERVHATVGAANSSSVHALDDPVPDLPELAAWCAAARLVVTADGGARHVAAAVGTPRVVVFGPTDPRHTADVWTDEVHLREPVPCGPCHREQCPLPSDDKDRCMLAVPPDALADAAIRCRTLFRP